MHKMVLNLMNCFHNFQQILDKLNLVHQIPTNFLNNFYTFYFLPNVECDYA